MTLWSGTYLPKDSLYFYQGQGLLSSLFYGGFMGTYVAYVCALCFLLVSDLYTNCVEEKLSKISHSDCPWLPSSDGYLSLVNTHSPILHRELDGLKCALTTLHYKTQGR